MKAPRMFSVPDALTPMCIAVLCVLGHASLINAQTPQPAQAQLLAQGLAAASPQFSAAPRNLNAPVYTPATGYGMGRRMLTGTSLFGLPGLNGGVSSNAGACGVSACPPPSFAAGVG